MPYAPETFVCSLLKWTPNHMGNPGVTARSSPTINGIFTATYVDSFRYKLLEGYHDVLYALSSILP